MKLLTVIGRLHQAHYLRATIIILLAIALVGGWLFLKRGESNDGLLAVSNVSQDKAASASELTQQEIEDLLDLKGEAFIEIARFKRSSDANEYWQYDSKFQEMVNGLEDYHRFILESGFRKEVESPDGGQRISYEQYYRLLIGPFSEENALKDQEHLVKQGYQNVFPQRVTKSEELYPLQKDKLLLLYTKNKGPKFTSGWLYLWFFYMEYVTSGNKMLLHPIDTSHGDRNGRPLFLIDGKDGTIREIDDFHSQGFVPLADSNKVLIHKMFFLSPKMPFDEKDWAKFPTAPLDKFDKADIVRVANEIGIKPDKIQAQLVGEGGGAAISALFEFDMETEEFRSLKVLGGLGGIFKMKDGRIFLSDSSLIASYKGQTPREKRLGIFGHKPYYLFDPSKKKLVKMPDDFVPDSDEVVQPLITYAEGAFATIAEAGIAKLISFRGSFYIQH